MIKKYARLILFCAVVTTAVLYFKELLGLVQFCLSVLRPVFIAVFFALIFNAPTRFFEEKIYRFKRQKLRRPAAMLTTYVLAAALVTLIVYLLVPQIAESVKGFAVHLPEYRAELQAFAEKLFTKYNIGGEAKAKITEAVTSALTSAVGGISETGALIGRLKTLFGRTTDVLFALILSVYMLADYKRLLGQLWRFIYAVFPDKISKVLNDGAKISGAVFSKFLSGQIIEAALLGVLTFAFMLIFRLPYPLLIAVVIFITNLIPILGQYVGAAIGILIVALVSPSQALVFAVLIFALQQFENNVTYPKVVGNGLGLSGFWVLAATVVGGGLFGFWGIMLGVPAVAVIYKMLGRRIGEAPTSATLLPDALKPSAEDTSDDGTEEGRQE